MRLFVGIGLPEEIKRHVAALSGGIPDAKWVPQDNCHVTLAFLGEVTEHDMADICLALGKIDYPAFRFTVRGVGMFGSNKRPRILWAGIEGAERMMGLQAKICQSLEQIGYPIDSRKFHPHITLARVHNAAYGKIRSFLGHHALFSAGSVNAHDFSLFSSHRSGSSPLYREEMAFDLKG